MKKRALSILLALLLLLSLVPAAASAASEMTASEACVEMIKKFEGFCKYPYKDYSQYTVGYGTRCPDEDLERYQQDGITEEEAETLLRTYLTSFEASVNKFIDKHELLLSQHQFDALVSFTYNFGPNWMNDSNYTFTGAVISGAVGNDFLYAITQWCTADGEILPSLAKRRLIEANMYLNGVYENAAPSNYQYVIFEYNGAPKIVRIQGYDASLTDSVRPVPTLSGYRFLGWYTANEGGQWITDLDAATAGLTLYARWQEGDGTEDSDGNVLGTPADYQRIATAGTVVRSIPSLRGEVQNTLASGTVVSIAADFVDANNIKWGKLSDGGWINLSQTKAQVTPAQRPVKPEEPEIPETPETPEEPEEEKPVEILVTVTNDYVNIRSGPGTSHSKVRKAYKGEQLLITETTLVGSTEWGKFSEGWICLDYTNYGTLTDNEVGHPDVVTATGVVNATKLNVRNGAGTNYAIVGSYMMGAEIEITQQKTVGGMEWGRTAKGWVCLDYVKLTPVGSTEEPEDTAPPEEPTIPEEPTTPEEPSAPEAPETDSVIATGTVVNCTTLRVRGGAGTSYDKVGTLNRGDKVEIYETTTVRGATWGRISSGWICLTYVQLDPTASDGEAAKAGVVNANGVNVRSGAGTHHAKVGTMNRGTKVEIFETTTVKDRLWGRMAIGWICMDYVTLTEDSGDEPQAPETSEPTQPSEPSEPSAPSEPSDSDTAPRTGTIVKCASLRVRSAAGTQNAQVASLVGGTRVTIYETTTINGTIWGRVDEGWISLYYVELDSTGESTTKIVDTDSLNIRSGAGTRYSKVGTYKRGTQVEILETTTVSGTVWGRTVRGWISLDYVI